MSRMVGIHKESECRMFLRDPRSAHESSKSIHLIFPRGIVTEQSRECSSAAAKKKQEAQKTQRHLDMVVD